MFKNAAQRLSLRSAKLQKFWGLHANLFREGLKGQKSRYAALCTADALSAVARTVVLGVIVQASHIASADQTTFTSPSVQRTLYQWAEAIGLQFGISVSSVAYLGASIISTISLAISVAAAFLVAVLARSIARSFHSRQVNRLLDSHVAKAHPDLLIQTTEKIRVQLGVMQYALHASKSLEQLVRLLQTILFAVIFLVAAFIIEWRIMSVLILLGLLCLPLVLLVSSDIHSSANAFYSRSAREMGGSVASLVNGMDGTYFPAEDRRGAVDDAIRSEQFRNYFDNYDKVQLAAERMNFLTGLVRAALFGVGMFLLTLAISENWASPSTMIAFAGTLFIAFSYVQSLLSRLASLNIHYPQVANFFNLRDGAGVDHIGSNLDRATTVADAPTFELRGLGSIDGKKVTGLRTSAELQTGNVVDFLISERASRYDMGRWLLPVFKASTPQPSLENFAFLAAAPKDLSPYTLGRVSQELQSRGFGGIGQFATTLGLPNSDEVIGPVLGEPNAGQSLDRAFLQTLSDEAKAYLSIVMSIIIPAQTIFLEGAAVRRAGVTELEALQTCWNEKLVFLIRTDHQPLLIEPKLHLALGSHGRLAIFEPNTSDDTMKAVLPAKRQGAGAMTDQSFLIG